MQSEDKLLLTDSERKYLEFIHTKKFAHANLMNAFIHIFIQQKPRKTLENSKTDKEVPESTCDHYLTQIFKAFESECPNLIGRNKGKSEILVQHLREFAKQEPKSRDELINPNLLDIDQNLNKYAETLKKFYNYLKLDSLSSETNDSDKMLLSGIFIPQTLRKSPPLSDIPKDLVPELEASGHIDCDYLRNIELRKAAYDECPTCSALEYIDDPNYKYSLITGDPGSGKSTLVNYIAIDWSNKRHLSNLLIPLIIELRKYIQELNKISGFLEYLHKGESSICEGILKSHHLEDYLKNGRAFVIFDGLDEVFDPISRGTIVSQIIRFSSIYPAVRILVTSRKIGYRGEPFRHAEFSELTIEDLNEKQIDDFSKQWHQIAFSDNSIECEKYQAKLTQAISESQAVRQLARNPLLLTMMAILNRHRELPRRRYQLYEAASELLLKNWDFDRQIRDESLPPEPILMKQKSKVLQNIAYFMQHSKSNLIIRDKLTNIFSQYLLQTNINSLDSLSLASRIIDQLRDRNFILCLYGGETYGFIHRTFLEFFCATEFLYQFEQQKITIDAICQQVLEVHWQDSTWHEVLRLLAGRLKEKFVAKMIRYLMGISINYQAHQNDFQQLKKSGIENLLFAAELLNEVQDRHAIVDTDSDLLEALKALTEENLDVCSNLALTDIFEKVWKDNYALNDWLNSIPEGLIDFNEPDDLGSDKEADYQKLRDLLRAREWEAADNETNRIMCEVGDKEVKGYLNKHDIEAFPCTDLKTIDRLWTKYSAGKLGFTTQRQIWLSIGGKPQAEYSDTKAEYNSFLLFSQRVGWFGDKILMREQVYQQKYKLKNNGLHPLVHKPLGHSTIRGFRFSSVFFPRVDTCGLEG